MWRNVNRDSDGELVDLDNAIAESYDTDLKGLSFFHGPMKGVKKGKVFSATHLFSAVSDTSSVELPFITGSNKAILLVIVKSTGQCEIEFEKGTTYSNAPADYGTEISSFNRNETSDNTAISKVYYGPTIDSNGTIFSYGLISGGGGRFSKTGGEASLDLRYIIEPNSSHLLRITNTSGSDSKIFVKGIWCE